MAVKAHMPSPSLSSIPAHQAPTEEQAQDDAELDAQVQLQCDYRWDCDRQLAGQAIRQQYPVPAPEHAA